MKILKLHEHVARFYIKVSTQRMLQPLSHIENKSLSLILILLDIWDLKILCISYDEMGMQIL